MSKLKPTVVLSTHRVSILLEENRKHERTGILIQQVFLPPIGVQLVGRVSMPELASSATYDTSPLTLRSSCGHGLIIDLELTNIIFVNMNFGLIILLFIIG